VPELDAYLPGHLTNGGTGEWGLMVSAMHTPDRNWLMWLRRATMAMEFRALQNNDHAD